MRKQAHRIVLDEQASQNLANMMDALRKEGSHLKLNASKAVSWLLNCFFEKYFEREKQRMFEAHFNKKEALMDILESIDDHAEEGRLDAMLKLCKAKPRNVEEKPNTNMDDEES